MAIEKALIACVKPYMVAARAQAAIKWEIEKGCNPDLAPYPVALEPPYNQISQADHLLEHDNGIYYTAETLPHEADIKRIQIWQSPEEEFTWLNSELFLKQLHSISHRVGFEIVGNRKDIRMRFLVHNDDIITLQRNL